MKKFRLTIKVKIIFLVLIIALMPFFLGLFKFVQEDAINEVLKEKQADQTEALGLLLGKNVPSDLEIRIHIKNGKYTAESNYCKKPSITAGSIWQPRSMPFDTEEKALENMLNFFESSNESYEKN